MKKLFTILTFAVVGFTFAQEEEPKFNVTGSVDAYFRANLSSSNDGDANTVLGTQGDFSAFNNDSGFSLGLANVTLSYEGEKVGFMADLAVGQRADQYNGEGSIVNEAYMYWNVSEKATLQMGRFNNWMGYESLSAANNFHYTMSHQFTYSTRNLDGIIARFDLGSDLRAGVGVMNPAEYSTGNTTGDFSIGAGITYKGKTGFSVLSSQSASYYDFKTAFKINENFNVKLNAHKADFGVDDASTGQQWTDSQVALVGLGAEGFTSFTAYPQLKIYDTLSWGLRLEYMMLDDEADTTVFTPTVTVRYSVGDLTIIPELRVDRANEDLFRNYRNNPDNFNAAFTLAAVYTF